MYTILSREKGNVMYWVVKDKMLWAHVFELIYIASWQCTYD